MCAPLSTGGHDATTASLVIWARRWRSRRRLGAAVRADLALACSLCLGTLEADAGPIDPATDVAAGPEGFLVDTLAASVPGLTRLADGADEVWTAPAFGSTIEVRPIIRHAGYANEFGIAAPGGTGPGAFHALFTAPGPSDWEAMDLPWLDLGAILMPGEAFVFGIRTPHYTVLS